MHPILLPKRQPHLLHIFYLYFSNTATQARTCIVALQPDTTSLKPHCCRLHLTEIYRFNSADTILLEHL